MLNDRELATILAALLYWREEMCPHDPSIMLPYFADLDLAHLTPLAAEEVEALIRKLRVSIAQDESSDGSSN